MTEMRPATRLAVAAMMTAAIAGCAKGGSTAPQTLAVAGRANAFLSLAADGDRVAATWVASSDAGADVFAAVSDDGGRRFSPAVRVNDIAGDAGGNGEQPPRVVLRDRELTVVWVSKRDGVSGIRAARSADGGRTFSPSRTISPAGVTGARGWESAAVGEGGLVHVAWLDGRNAAPMAPGAPHVHGAMRQDIVHAMWRADGSVVETPVAENVCFCCKTGVAVHGNDVFVVWRHLFAGGVRDIAIARSTDGGGTFGAPQRVSADNWKIDACPDDGPSLAVENGGAIHVAWPTLMQDEATPHMAIFEAISRDGGATFSPRRRVDASRTGASHPRLAVGAGGAHAIVWDETSPEGRQAMIRLADGPAAALPATGSASYPAVVSTRSGFLAGWTEQAPGGSVVRVAAVGR
jgi:BNR repeat-like domain